MAHPFYYFCRFGCKRLPICNVFKRASKARKTWAEIANLCPGWQAMIKALESAPTPDAAATEYTYWYNVTRRKALNHVQEVNNVRTV